MNKIFGGFSATSTNSRSSATKSLLPAKALQFGGKGDSFTATIHWKEKEAEACKQAYATVDRCDYRRTAFNEESGQEFLTKPLATHFDIENTPDTSGKDLLTFLLTPKTIDSIGEKEWQSVDYTQLGKTRAEVIDFFEDKARVDSEGRELTFPQGFADKALNTAYRDGLVSLAYNLKDGHDVRGRVTTYYGVPSRVRAALELSIPQNAMVSAVGLEEGSTENTPLQEFTETLLRLANQVKNLKNLPIGDEILEYTAQLALAAVERRLLSKAELPPELIDKADQMRLASSWDTYSLIDASEGMESIHEMALQLHDAARKAKLVTEEDGVFVG